MKPIVVGAALLPVAAAAVAAILRWLLWCSEYADRVAVIQSWETVIDNEAPYDTPSDWAENGTQGLLHKITPHRVAYFQARLATVAPVGGGPLQILDAGCGGGLVTVALARHGHNVTGIDPAAGAVEYAHSSAGAQGLQELAHFHRGSIYTLPFADSSFDAVVCSDVLEHLTDLPSALREMRRVLRPGGLLLVDTIHRTLLSYIIVILGLEVVLGAVPRHAHDFRLFITPEELVAALEAAGFRVGSQQGFRPSLAFVIDTIRAYVLRTLPVEKIHEGLVIEAEGSPGFANYFATAKAIEEAAAP